MLAALHGDDAILCQITSQEGSDAHSVPLDSADFTVGGSIKAGEFVLVGSLRRMKELSDISGFKLDEVLDRLIAILRVTAITSLNQRQTELKSRAYPAVRSRIPRQSQSTNTVLDSSTLVLTADVS